MLGQCSLRSLIARRLTFASRTERHAVLPAGAQVGRLLAGACWPDNAKIRGRRLRSGDADEGVVVGPGAHDVDYVPPEADLLILILSPDPGRA